MKTSSKGDQLDKEHGNARLFLQLPSAYLCRMREAFDSLDDEGEAASQDMLSRLDSLLDVNSEDFEHVHSTQFRHYSHIVYQGDFQHARSD